MATQILAPPTIQRVALQVANLRDLFWSFDQQNQEVFRVQREIEEKRVEALLANSAGDRQAVHTALVRMGKLTQELAAIEMQDVSLLHRARNFIKLMGEKLRRNNA